MGLQVVHGHILNTDHWFSNWAWGYLEKDDSSHCVLTSAEARRFCPAVTHETITSIYLQRFSVATGFLLTSLMVRGGGKKIKAVMLSKLTDLEVAYREQCKHILQYKLQWKILVCCYTHTKYTGNQSWLFVTPRNPWWIPSFFPHVRTQHLPWALMFNSGKRGHFHMQLGICMF